jgi:hypothetical protein
MGSEPSPATWSRDTHSFFTIGHSTRTIAEFAGLLRDSGVGLVVDVRSMPRSRTNPQFNLDNLPEALAPWHIGYEHISELGGLRGRSRGAEGSVNGLWRVRSFRNYADNALTAPFAAGLARLRPAWHRATLRGDVRRGGVLALPPPHHCRLPAGRGRSGHAHSQTIACRCGQSDPGRRGP